MWASIILFFSIFSGLYFGFLKPNPFINSFFIITFLLPIGTNIYGNTEYFPLNFEVISELKINSNFISIGDREISFDSIKKIDIAVNDWHGKKIIQNVRPYGSGPKLSRGVNNKIKIVCRNLTEEIFSFQLDSEEMFYQLSNCIKDLYLKDIDIYETYDNMKSYGLRHLNYSEIQDFKIKFQPEKN